jgi:hypothetical protein
VLFPIVLLGQIPVVDAAQQLKIVYAMVAAAAIRVFVMELQPLAGWATSSARVYKRALISIALPNRPPHRGRDVA